MEGAKDEFVRWVLVLVPVLLVPPAHAISPSLPEQVESPLTHHHPSPSWGAITIINPIRHNRCLFDTALCYDDYFAPSD